MRASHTDPDKFARLQSLILKAIEAYGGKFLVREGRSGAFAGSMRPSWPYSRS
ncbi:hypothetical protein [Caballeronia sp. 15715]|uniref:hypothetical protein n=1 Tax=unclassified Caballeronia TaxID=2646786 RepID=UPI0039E65264